MKRTINKRNWHDIMYIVLIAALSVVSFAACCGDDETPVPREQIYKIGGVSFKMIRVEHGTFTMGDDSDPYDCMCKPAHQVILTNDYWIGETEVTQELWYAVMGNNPSFFTGEANLPVERVNWNEIQIFITKLDSITGKNFRLPTEAEWEFAARGGNKSHNYLYSGSNNFIDVAQCSENNGISTVPVKTKKANELGIYDMSGNVWEWCNDWDEYYTAESQTNPQGADIGVDKILRGGSYSDYAIKARVSFRIAYQPERIYNDFGFRLALSAN